jgi:hypothetical protein
MSTRHKKDGTNKTPTSSKPPNTKIIINLQQPAHAPVGYRYIIHTVRTLDGAASGLNQPCCLFVCLWIFASCDEESGVK